MSDDCGLPPYRIHCKPNASYRDGYNAFLQIGTEITPELQVLSFSTQTISLNATHLNAINTDCSPFSQGHASLAFFKQGRFSFTRDNFFVVMGCYASGTCYVHDDLTKPSNAAQHGTTNSFSLFAIITIVASLPFLLRRPVSITTALGCSALPVILFVRAPKAILRYNCNCTKGYSGDGYKAGIGCVDIDECALKLDECDPPPKGRCINTNGSYTCSCVIDDGSQGSANYGKRGTCPSNNSTYIFQVSGSGRFPLWIVPTAAGVGALIVIISMIFIIISRRTIRRRRKRQQNFQRVGGQQLVSFLFSERVLMKATENFSKKNLIGQGGFAKVYFGKLSMVHGTRKVAIKRAKAMALEEQVAQMQTFVKEILLLRKAAHNNVVQLLGCCVETSVPLLVYEYVENGTVRDYLKPQGRNPMIVMQGRTTSFQSLWAWRLYNYNPKVADFGLSCLLTSDVTHLSNPIAAGTLNMNMASIYPSYQYKELHISIHTIR
ncbi:hypothetical protein KP509_29G035200 [Ceratopteris richardii]|uniref:Protein kinase domain-containing protein n=1 Tax=Ceratopteris richardii TaxID=49495 RepID=A0A8T2R613_CERRI|nr:hypothetical protein KP509_29G035200 [Ceratopteris richardii]